MTCDKCKAHDATRTLHLCDACHSGVATGRSDNETPVATGPLSYLGLPDDSYRVTKFDQFVANGKDYTISNELMTTEMVQNLVRMNQGKLVVKKCSEVQPGLHALAHCILKDHYVLDVWDMDYRPT